MTRLRFIVTGLIAQHPRLGGVAWDYLQYLIGFERLGHSVTYIEDSGQWPYRLDGDGKTSGGGANAAHLAAVLARYGFRGPWAYRCAPDGEWFGMAESARRDAISGADLLINVSGSVIDPEPYAQVPVRVYIDSDPAFTQIRAEADPWFNGVLGSFNLHFTFGENLCAAALPTAGFLWLPTRSPIVTDLWEDPVPTRKVFTTVMSWASYRPLSYKGVDYAQKDVEFRRFLDLPAVAPYAALEVAFHPRRHRAWETAGPTEREAPDELLPARGWKTANSLEVAGTPESYRRYIQTSMAEWGVAKGGYVIGRTGWFSCRSSCYLAAGRPVVVQDTGFREVLPCGEGIVAFDDMASAAAGLETVRSDYDRHARAARELAHEYFDSGKVLTSLIERAFQPVSCVGEVRI